MRFLIVLVFPNQSCWNLSHWCCTNNIIHQTQGVVMKKPYLLSLVALVGMANAATYEIDPFHTNARFAIDYFKTNTNVGGGR